MKKRVWLAALFLCVLACAAVSASSESDLCAGPVLGEPTGLSAKYWLGTLSAVDAALGWSFRDNGALYIDSDYLYHFLSSDPRSEGEFSLYAGGGVFFAFRDDLNFGLRVPAGASYRFEIPLESFGELVPALRLVPDTRLELVGGVGVRYCF